MPAEYFLFIVVILLLTAVADLVVGVANDAVNFLNSAIGSRVATRNVIMTVASLGILIGATFSSGMMEIARKGILNPALFSFADVMVIFLAVMLTDILLLDLFNTFGMPTSTTVSIVFELLGAAVAVAFFKVMQAGEALPTVSQYINASSTLTIISGIFLSVSIAFVVGTSVQWLSRLLFSFQYEKRMPLIGGIWAGLSLAGITYFLLFKGMKGASFMPEAWVQWTSRNAESLFWGSAVFWTLLIQVLISVFKVNVLRGVVLFGTFALAMAFAGNDLVNFIGVPLAGLDAYLIWKNTGAEAGSLMMESLTKPVRTNTWMLLAAGIVMILTLWFSRKARTVTDTEVNLGRQDDGAERFPSNRLARGLVWYSRKYTAGLTGLLPASWLSKAENSFTPPPQGPDAPAFDLIRASVNLTAASSLIALATSLKLPLSTTYVTFMVAMGSSLADRAWGRGSAVYRVAGVLNVIGGWFLTAIIAFSVAALFACILFFGGLWGIGFLLIAGVGLLARTYFFHGKQERRKKEQDGHTQIAIDIREAIHINIRKSAKLLRHTGLAYQKSIRGLLEENTDILQAAGKEFEKIRVDKGTLQLRLYRSIKHLEEGDIQDISRLFLKVYEIEQDTVQSIALIVESCNTYVKDSLPPFEKVQQLLLEQLAGQLVEFTQTIAAQLDKSDEAPEVTEALKLSMLQAIDEGLSLQIHGLREGDYGMRNSALWFSLLLETRDLIHTTDRFKTAFWNVQTAHTAFSQL
jgi:phosphate/sulfate permease